MQFQNCMEFGYPLLIFGLFLLRPKFITVLNLAWATYGMETFSILDFQVVNLHAQFLSEHVNTYTSHYVIFSEFTIFIFYIYIYIYIFCFLPMKKNCIVVEIKYLCCFFIFFILGLLLTNKRHYGISGVGKRYG